MKTICILFSFITINAVSVFGQTPFLKPPVLVYKFNNDIIVGGDVADIDGDGVADMLIATAQHQTPAFLKNTGTKTSYQFNSRLNQPFQLGFPDVYDELVLEPSADPAMNTMDLFFFKILENRLKCALAIGTATTPKFKKPAVPNPFGLTLPINDPGRITPSFVDVNLDGYRDCVMSFYGGNNNRWTWVFFRNKTSVQGYTLDGLNGIGLPSPGRATSAFRFADFDLDGDADAFYADTDQTTWKIFYAENVMTSTDVVIRFATAKENPFEVDITKLSQPDLTFGSDNIRVDLEDIDSDGDVDLFVFLEKRGEIFLYESMVIIPSLTDVETGAVTTSSIDLSWGWPANGRTTGFVVMRSISESGPFEAVGKVDAKTVLQEDVILYTDSGLESNTTYYYQVVGQNEYFTATASNTVSATTQEAAAEPTGIPTLFTPNGDGVNDTWNAVPHLAIMGSYTLRVFNRNGKEVFRTTQDNPQEWDGSYHGRALADGTYSYTVEGDKVKKVKGMVTLLRD